LANPRAKTIPEIPPRSAVSTLNQVIPSFEYIIEIPQPDVCPAATYIPLP
jgi:hypothetical protein